VRIYTIGFTGKNAREFFEKLQSAEARHLLDIRIHNSSQLASFTKKGNIEYFLEKLTRLHYVEVPLLAPEEEAFKQYRQDSDWPAYERKYLELMRDRRVTQDVDGTLFKEGGVLLCSEPTPERCHRRLAAEFLRDEVFREADIVHL
jgi:uncharacterized protein (DUF488 family)